MTTDPPLYRFVDGDGFCLSARLLPDLNNGGNTDTMSITIEGSDEPQSVHVPASAIPEVAAGIVAAAGQPAAQSEVGRAATAEINQRLNAAATDEERRERYRRAVCQSDGFTFDDIEPDDYVTHADAVMAVADAEQADLRNRVAELEQLLADRKAYAAQADELSRIAHETSNWAETERARAAARVAVLERQAAARDTTGPDLRDRIAAALDNAHRTHPCPATGSTYWTGCYHHDGSSRHGMDCHTERRTDAVLAVLPTTTDRATALADAERAVQEAGASCSYGADAGCDFCGGINSALAAIRRPANEAQHAEPARCSGCDHQRGIHTGTTLFCAVPACDCTRFADGEAQPGAAG